MNVMNPSTKPAVDAQVSNTILWLRIGVNLGLEKWLEIRCGISLRYLFDVSRFMYATNKV